ncbi:hypothetical protein [Streptomyces sp. NPDC049915]|uniref:hypothetical protein n=1 Tax=Streptomyces sp. NPDC049915 TaxID=3155510 RepID=UPI003422AA3D
MGTLRGSCPCRTAPRSGRRPWITSAWTSSAWGTCSSPTPGGPVGAAVYLESFSVDHDTLADVQARIQPLRPAPTASILCEDNRVTDEAAGIQLRYGPDGRWYPYRAPYGIWQPVPGPSADPAEAYRAARRSNQRIS